jgi:hypothetical protein
MTRQDTTTKPTASEALATTTDEGLLRTFAALSRRMQREETRMGGRPGSSETRDQRDLVEAEVLRRMRRAL